MEKEEVDRYNAMVERIVDRLDTLDEEDKANIPPALCAILSSNCTPVQLNLCIGMLIEFQHETLCQYEAEDEAEAIAATGRIN